MEAKLSEYAEQSAILWNTANYERRRAHYQHAKMPSYASQCKALKCTEAFKTWSDLSQSGKRMWKLEPFPIMMCDGTHVKNTKEIGQVEVSRGKKPGRGRERIEITLKEQTNAIATTVEKT